MSLVRPRRRPVAPVVGRSEELTERQRRVAWALLRRFIEHRNERPGVLVPSLTRRELAQRARMPDRTVRDEVKALRRAGWPVCSLEQAPGGYWLTEDPFEWEAFIHDTYESRLGDLNQTAQAMRVTLAALHAKQFEGSGSAPQIGMALA